MTGVSKTIARIDAEFEQVLLVPVVTLTDSPGRPKMSTPDRPARDRPRVGPS